MHIVVNRNMDLKNAEVLKENIKRKLHELHITHATIEVEYDPDH